MVTPEVKIGEGLPSGEWPRLYKGVSGDGWDSIVRVGGEHQGHCSKELWFVGKEAEAAGLVSPDSPGNPAGLLSLTQIVLGVGQRKPFSILQAN